MTKIDEEALEKAFLAEPQSGEDWFDTVAGATGLTDEENRTLLRCAITAYLTALEAKGLVIVPRELDSKNMDHWYVADAGIKCIEDYGGDMGSDHTPEMQISTVYKEMVSAIAARGEG